MPNPQSTIHNPKSADVLFELGTEELPAAYLPGLIEQCKTEAETLLRGEHLAFERVESVGTPRRLALIVRKLASAQRKPAQEIRGPSQQVCYDPAGEPTKALLGFLKSQGGTLRDVKLVPSQKGAYVYLTKRPTVTPATRLLPALLPKLVGALRAPKTMRWDASGLRFARPIRWMAALYGRRPIRCTIGRLTSYPMTWIGGPLRPRRVPIKSLEEYRRVLTRAGIMLDQAARKRWIEQQVAGLARRSGGRAAQEMVRYGLLDEVTHLVERPVPVAGAFDPRYLALPREVLLASMGKHQRVFAVEGQDGALLPRFVAILDGKPTQPAAVRKTMERILNARLADSLLFWEEDRRQPLDALAAKASGITFHEGLGSMADKSGRLHTLAAVLEQAWKLSAEETDQLRRACRFAKADLASTLVREFPTLQGVMGKHYALQAGEPQAVAQAIGEQYLPLGERRPESLVGRALAMLDKYDTLASCFSFGKMPTGDEDPFGLRRAAQGIVEIAWDARRSVPLNRLLEARASLSPFVPPKGSRDPVAHVAQVREQINRYLLERLYTFEWPSPRPSTEWIDAVLASDEGRAVSDDLVEIMERIAHLSRLNGEPARAKAAKVIERTRNILKGVAGPQAEVDPAHLKAPEEQRLWHRYQEQHGRIRALVEQRAYAEATRRFGEAFFEPLHEFFDKVLVNDPDETLRRNRLALMRTIQTLYTDRVADLSRLTLVQPMKEVNPS
jgi:glycyl-tRNA synthetase beta chain